METCGMIILYQDKRARLRSSYSTIPPLPFLLSLAADSLLLPFLPLLSRDRGKGLFLTREREYFALSSTTATPVTAIMSKYNENGVFNSHGYFHTSLKRNIYWYYHRGRKLN